jgi:DNA polymerase I-like protein with 3'-5' exonuclease and polymerase domains
MIQFDVETTGFQPYSGARAFIYQFEDDAGNREVIDADDRDRIQAWFDRGKEEGIEAWNTKFDRHFAHVAGFDLPPDGAWHDGMVKAQTINERRSVALSAVTEELFGDEGKSRYEKPMKEWLNKENARRRKAAVAAGEEFIPANYSDVPRDLMDPYALEDVTLTRKVGLVYNPIIESTADLKRCYEFERKAMDALWHVERRGIPASAEDYHKLLDHSSEKLDKLREQVVELAGDPEFNPNSSGQVIDALKRRGADMRFMETTDGEIKKADAENLEAVDDELAQAILNFRAENKVMTTYVLPMINRTYVSAMNSFKEPFIAPDGRIHATYRQVGARTGRMSCADPNMQNQPRDDLRLRYCIKAEPGRKLVACDLSNIEMYIFAAYAGEGRLLDTLKAGGDVHTLTAEMLGLRGRQRPNGFETPRQQGKVYNFTTIYGGGLRSVRRYFRVDTNTARLYKRRYAEAYPEIGTLSERIEVALYQRGYVQDSLISGRRFRCDDPQKEAYKFTNYLVQGTAAALLKEALIKLHADGVPVVALVHDEIVADVEEKDAEEVKNLIIKRMTENERLNEIVPISADGVICDRWSDAKPNKDGSLFVAPWEEAA